MRFSSLAKRQKNDYPVMMKTIAIIDCAIDEPSLACYNRLLQLGFPVSYHSACDFGMSTLKNLDHFYGAFIFGSISNVEDDEPWHRELRSWALNALQRGLPIMGICFGHQLMCHALGGKVIKNKSVDPEQKGSRKVTFKNRFGGIKSGEVLEFIVSHSWRVTDLPHDFEEVAGSVFPNDIVRHKTLPFVGIQPHPEASDHFIETEFENDSLEKENADRTKVDGIRFIIDFVKEYCTGIPTLTEHYIQ